MTAYHAIHESPYDDACPDCTGFGDEDYARDSRQFSRRLVPWAWIGAALIVLMALYGMTK